MGWVWFAFARALRGFRRDMRGTPSEIHPIKFMAHLHARVHERKDVPMKGKMCQSEDIRDSNGADWWRFKCAGEHRWRSQFNLQTIASKRTTQVASAAFASTAFTLQRFPIPLSAPFH